MDFDPLFEDLEARFFASQNSSEFAFSLELIKSTTSLQVLTIDGQRLTLLAPVLGQGFAAGLQSEAAIWMILPMPAIKNLRFSVDEKSTLPRLSLEEFSLLQYLERLPLPAKCLAKTIGRGSILGESTLVGVGYDLLFLQLSHQDSIAAIPLGSLAQLSMAPVHNSHTLF